MDEPVRWVTKAEAAQELEVSLSTLDRMIRKGEVEVARESRRVDYNRDSFQNRSLRLWPRPPNPLKSTV